MPSWLQAVLISSAALAVYFGLRAIPASKCEFLHYEVTEVTAEGDTVCEVDVPPAFMNLQRMQFPASLRIDGAEALRAGERAELTVEVLNAHGEALLPHELAITHTRKLHLMIVDPSLGDYRHIHPEPLGASSQWAFSFTPRAGGEYFLVAEFVPVRTLKPVVAHTYLPVGGARVLAEPQPLATTQLAGHTFTLETLRPRGELRTGQDAELTLTVARADGEPVELEPVMDALAHMVAFDGERTGYAHLHPLQPEEDAMQPGKETLAFVFNTSEPGDYRLWAQVRIDGQDRYAPFDLTVR